jgi:hypothetical protein
MRIVLITIAASTLCMLVQIGFARGEMGVSSVSPDTRQIISAISGCRNGMAESALILPIVAFRELREEAGQPDLFPDAPAGSIVHVSGGLDSEATLL